METFIFWPMAVVALLTALGMVMARNAVHSALMLVLNFFSIAVFYVLLDAHFLAAAQVIVYAGAIMILFLFVIMLTGVAPEEEDRDPIKGQRPLSMLFVAALAGMLVFVMRSVFGAARFGQLAEANRSGNPQGLGRALFTHYLFPFEVTSLLLVVAAIGVVLLGRRRLEGVAEDEAEDEQALPVGIRPAGEESPVSPGEPIGPPELQEGGGTDAP